MSAFVDVEAAQVDGPVVAGGAGGRRAGSGRRRRNPDSESALDKQGRFWLFTVFYAEADKEAAVARVLGQHGVRGCSYVVYGEEMCPDTGRAHLQCYAEFATRVRGRTVKAGLGDLNPHMDPVTNVLPDGKKTTWPWSRWNCFTYCTKGSEARSQDGPNPSWVGEERGTRPVKPGLKRGFDELESEISSSNPSAQF